MTDDNKKANVERELERARDCLRAADALIGLGLHADAVSRAYYGAFHVVLALLFTRGLEPRSHAGAFHLLNVELVRPGLVASSHMRLLAGPQRSRELADYDSASVFSADDARAPAGAPVPSRKTPSCSSRARVGSRAGESEHRGTPATPAHTGPAVRLSSQLHAGPAHSRSVLG